MNEGSIDSKTFEFYTFKSRWWEHDSTVRWKVQDNYRFQLAESTTRETVWS
jgi:hypothetical protein